LRAIDVVPLARSKYNCALAHLCHNQGMRHHLLILLLALPLLISPAAAAASPADDEFDAGARAFREQDYRQALYHFTRAEKAGMRAARLDYNFGVVLYRLEQYAGVLQPRADRAQIRRPRRRHRLVREMRRDKRRR
jgi:hypothetical protein